MLEASVEKLLQEVSEDFRAKLFDVQELLSGILLTLKKFDTVYEYTGKKFNIFDILGIGDKEVMICRFMRELLSPFGSHYRGTIFLRSFVKKVLKLNIPDSELENAEVSCEFRTFRTKKNRRIDIVIKKTGKYFIPIEVKIYAGDRESQIKDYADEGKKCGNNYFGIYYLTRYGEEPSATSSCGEKVKCISFKENITEWLEYCLRLPEVINTITIRENLSQFATTVKKFTDQTEDEIKMEIIDRIKASPQNLRAAKEIFSVFNNALRSLKKECFEKVEKKVQEKQEKQEKKQINPNRYSDGSGAGIFYKINENYGVRFGYEEEEGKYAGFFIGYYSDWWLDGWEEYTIENEISEETLYELCNDANMEKFTNKCADKIIELLYPSKDKNNGA